MIGCHTHSDWGTWKVRNYCLYTINYFRHWSHIHRQGSNRITYDYKGDRVY